MIEHWHDFFVMVGGATAALTGLVFVAMSINLESIAKDVTHRNRAIGTLTGFTAAFMICAFALMGDQNYKIVGIEWLIIAAVSTAIYVNGYIQAMKIGKSSVGLRTPRLIVGTSLYIAEIIGSIMLILGYTAGFYVAAISLIGLLAFTITGAWLLLIGVCTENEKRKSS